MLPPGCWCIAEVLKPLRQLGSAQNALEDPLKTLKEKLGQCKLCAVTPRKKVSEQEVEQRQNADGFIIDGVTYVKQDRVKAWFPDKSSRIALRQTGVFHARAPIRPQ